MPETLDLFKGYVDRKLTLAERLADGECGGDYADACVLISALISGVAADLWPGPGIDRHRFVEAWVRYADPVLQPNRISVPLLVRRLRKNHRGAEAVAIEALRPSAFGGGQSSRVLLGDDVDATEVDVLQACPGLKVKDVRQLSYPVVFYEHVRSTLVHEFHFDSRAAPEPMTDQDTNVSYVNILDTKSVPSSQRRIHFHAEWLIGVARSIATGAAGDLPSRPLPKPTAWWSVG